MCIKHERSEVFIKYKLINSIKFKHILMPEHTLLAFAYLSLIITILLYYLTTMMMLSFVLIAMTFLLSHNLLDRTGLGLVMVYHLERMYHLEMV